MSNGFPRRGLPRGAALRPTDPDLQLLFANLFFHGSIADDPVEPREGDLWIRADLDPIELRAWLGGEMCVLATSSGSGSTVEWDNVTGKPPLESPTGAQAKADAAEVAAKAYADALLDAFALLADPFPQYLTDAEADLLYEPLGEAAAELLAHLAAGDPHGQYLLETVAGATYVLLSDPRLTDARFPTAHALNNTSVHTGTLDKAQQHAQTAYLDGAAGQAFLNALKAVTLLNVGSQTLDTGLVVGDQTAVLDAGSLTSRIGITIYSDANAGVASLLNLVCRAMTGTRGNAIQNIMRTDTGVFKRAGAVSFIGQGTWANGSAAQQNCDVVIYVGAAGVSSEALRINSSRNATLVGTLTASTDADSTHILGRGKIFAAVTDNAMFAHFDQATAAAYALRQLPAGETRLNTPTGQVILLCVNDAEIARIAAAGLTVLSDTDATTTLGRAKLFSSVTDNAMFAHFDRASAAAGALRQTAAGETHLNAPTGQVVVLSINDVEVARVAVGGFSSGKPIHSTGEIVGGSGTSGTHIGTLGSSSGSVRMESAGFDPCQFSNISGIFTLDFDAAPELMTLDPGTGILTVPIVKATVQTDTYKLNDGTQWWPALFKRIAANVNLAASTTVALPDLTLAVQANEVWKLEYLLPIIVTGGTAGLKYQFSLPTGTTVGNVLAEGTTSTSTTVAPSVLTESPATLGATAYLTASFTGWMRIEAVIVVGANAGNISMGLVTGASAAGTVRANGHLRATRIA